MLPARMNLATVRIKRLLISTTTLDDEFKEPTRGKAYDDTEDFLAQVRNPKFQMAEKNFGGNVPDTKLILVYRTPADANDRLKIGDKLVGLPNGSGTYDTVDLVVMENKPIGHLPNPLAWMARLGNNADTVESAPAER